MSTLSQWRNAGELVAYPFAEGVAPILEHLLVDAQVMIPSDAAGAYLSALLFEGESIVGSISTLDDRAIGTFSFKLDSLGAKTANIVDSNGIVRGVVVSGGPVDVAISEAREQKRIFLPQESKFETACLIRVAVSKVSSLTIGGKTLRGKVALAEGAGIRMTKIDGSTIQVDAIGAPEPREACCDETTDPIKGVNEALPDQFGNILFSLLPFGEAENVSDAVQALRISPRANGIAFSLAK